MSRTHRPLPIELKQFDAAQGTFGGLGAVFGNLDYNGDIIDRGAFADTLRELRATKAKTGSPYLVPLLWMHDKNAPVGGVTDAYETADGLAITCQCDLNTERGQAVFSGIKKGYANGLSIGYNTLRASNDAQGIRHLSVIRLLEISVITMGFAANPLALADSLSAKSRKDDSMNRDDWKNQRLPLGPYIPTYTPDPPVPETKDYADETEFKRALNAWRVKVWGVPATPNSADEARTQAERLQDHRAAQPGASVEDVQAYVKRHGCTPDGRKVEDTSAAVERAYAAIERKLRDAAE